MNTKTLHLNPTPLKEKKQTIVSYKGKVGIKKQSRLIPVPDKKIIKKREIIDRSTEIERYKEIFLKKFYEDIQKYHFENFEKLDVFIEGLKERYLPVYLAIKQNQYKEDLKQFISDYEALENLFEDKKIFWINENIENLKKKLIEAVNPYEYLSDPLKGRIYRRFLQDPIKDYIDNDLLKDIIKDVIDRHNSKKLEAFDKELSVFASKLKEENIEDVLLKIQKVIPNFDPIDIDLVANKYLNLSLDEILQHKKDIFLNENNTFLEMFSNDLKNACSFNARVSFLSKYNRFYNEIYFKNMNKEFDSVIKEYDRLKDNVNFASRLKGDLEKRNIDLFHFSQVENLSSIIKNGLLSVYQLRQKGIQFLYNDSERNDNKANSICCSIGFPNIRLLRAYLGRKLLRVKYIIFELDQQILWDKKCFVCSKNAATNYGNNIEELNNMTVFSSLFENKDSKYTINSQAEVLVRECIETNYIKCIHVYSEEEYNIYSKLYPDFRFSISPELFRYRKVIKDWET